MNDEAATREHLAAQAQALAASIAQWLPEQFISLDVQIDELCNNSTGIYRELLITAATTRDGQTLTRTELADSGVNMGAWLALVNLSGGTTLASSLPENYHVQQRLQVRGNRAGELCNIGHATQHTP